MDILYVAIAALALFGASTATAMYRIPSISVCSAGSDCCNRIR